MAQQSVKSMDFAFAGLQRLPCRSLLIVRIQIARELLGGIEKRKCGLSKSR
jgi:hypothetical protein